MLLRSIQMNSKRKPYKTYTKEFKVEAVRLMNASNIPSSELAAQLGVRRNQLYKWKAQLEDKGDKAFSNNLGRPRKENQSELVTLRQENERLKEEVEILKKAAAYFARELK
jgi:transposase